MSLRLKMLTRFMALFVKPQLEKLASPVAARLSNERTARRVFPVPPYALFLEDHMTFGGHRCGGLWSSVGDVAARRVILYFHGGGYVVGSATTHRALTARISRHTHVRVFAPDYRLAPEHPYPAALEDARLVYSALLSRGYRPDDIVIGGDSAGGGLALALLSRLCAEGAPPVGVFAFSPWTDLSLSGESMRRNEKSDVILPVTRIRQMRDYYVAGGNPSDPGISPLFADYPDCPPVLLQYSSSEILADDSVRMAQRLRGQGARVEVQHWDDAPHVWQLFDGVLPEANEALEATGAFVTQVFSTGSVKASD